MSSCSWSLLKWIVGTAAEFQKIKCSCSFNPSEAMESGQSIGAFVTELLHSTVLDGVLVLAQVADFSFVRIGNKRPALG